MMAISMMEFNQTILRLNREKKYGDTLKYFKDFKASFTNQQIGGNVYLVAAMLAALRHTKNLNSAFRFLEIYQIDISATTKEMILNAYGWLLFSKFKAENQQSDHYQDDAELFEEDELPEGGGNFHFNKSEIVGQIEKLIPFLTQFEDEYAYTLLSNLFSSVLKAEKKKPNANWKLVSDFCDLVSPDQLHTDCQTIEVERKGVKKDMELASDKENWYAYKSKALMKLGKFEECYELSKQALDLFKVFHYSNDSWFARRIALSKKNMGNSADAIVELQKVLRRKKEWFIQKELAVLYKESGDWDKAFKYAISAINNFGDLEYKVDLLFLLGELLKEKEQADMAFKHFSLSYLLRKQEEWNIPAKLQTALSEFGKPAIPIEILKELKTELKSYWNSFNAPPIRPAEPTTANQRFSGKIDRILHNDEKGADGFIRFDGKKTIYFRVNTTEEIIQKISVGLEVEFKMIPATGDKKGKAIQLKIRQGHGAGSSGLGV